MAERTASAPVASSPIAAPARAQAAPPNPFLANAAPSRAEPVSLIPIISIPVSTAPGASAVAAEVHVPHARVPVIDVPAAPRVVTAPARVPGGSIPPTGLGVVVTAGAKTDLLLPTGDVRDIELPDFGRKRRLMGRAVVGLLLLAVAAAIMAMVLSRS